MGNCPSTDMAPETIGCVGDRHEFVVAPLSITGG